MIRDLIKKHEGFSNVPYKCPAGKQTIGWGHNIDAHPLPKDIEGYLFAKGYILPEHAERLLSADIEMATQDCRQLYPGFDGFSDKRRAALIDFLYNIGIVRAKGFKLMQKAILAGDWNEAAEQVRDSAYWRQLGGDPIGTDDGRTERPEVIYRMLKEG